MMELSRQVAGSPPARGLEPYRHARATPQPAQPAPAVGAQISMLKWMRYGHGASGLGRIGGFGARTDARRWSELFLLSNAHVLNAHGAGVGDTVFQPSMTMSADTVRFDPDKINPIALLEDPGHEGPYRFAYPGEETKNYFIDCATARLLDGCASPCGAAAFAAIARAHPLDLRPGRGLPVRLLGLHDRPAGRIVDTATTVSRADGVSCPNTLVLETLPGREPFATPGDSGALVVDAFDRAVGLLWGVDLACPTRAFACHLVPVLDRLGLVLSRRTSVVRRSLGRDQL